VTTPIDPVERAKQIVDWYGTLPAISFEQKHQLAAARVTLAAAELVEAHRNRALLSEPMESDVHKEASRRVLRAWDALVEAIGKGK